MLITRYSYIFVCIFYEQMKVLRKTPKQNSQPGKAPDWHPLKPEDTPMYI